MSAVVIAIMIAVGIGIMAYRKRPDVIERRSLRAINALDARRLGAPTRPTGLRRWYDAIISQVEQLRRNGYVGPVGSYEAIISQLEQLRTKRDLGPAGREALGRAYLGAGVLLLTEKQAQAGQRRINQAAQFVPVSQADMVAPVARALIAKEETGANAIDTYINYLSLAETEADECLTDSVLGILKEACKIDEKTSSEDMRQRMAWNGWLLGIPGPHPRLVSRQEDGAVLQRVITGPTRIGRSPDSEFVLVDPTVSRKHACVTVEDNEFVIRDLDSRGGTLVRGQRIKEPTILRDGDRIRCGNSVIEFHPRPRILARELDWCQFYRGVGWFRSQDYARAKESFLRAQALAPNEAETAYQLGRTHQALGDYASACLAYANALQNSPDHAAAHYWWGRALVEHAQASAAAKTSEAWQSRITEAIHHFEKATELDPKNDRYFYGLAKVLALADDSAGATKALEAAIAINSKAAAYHAMRARLARQTDDTSTAKQSAQAVLSIDSDHCEALHILGELAFEEQEYALAATHLGRLLSIETKKKVSTYSGSPQFAWYLGRSLFEIGKYAAASRVLAPIAKVPTLSQSRDAFFYGARCHSCTGHFESAARLFRSLLRRHREDAEVRYYLASSLGNLGQFDEALSELSKAEGNGTWAARRLCLSARLLMRMGRVDDAATRLADAEQMEPSNAEVYFERGRLATVKGDFEEAVIAFSTSLREAPTDVQSHLWLGRAFFAQKRNDMARQHFTQALAGLDRAKLDEKSTKHVTAAAHFHLGRIAHSEGAYADAIQAFTKARHHGCGADRLAVELAACYVETGNYPDALAELSSLSMNDQADQVIGLNMAAVSVRMADEHLRGGRFKEAAALLDQARSKFTTAGATHEAEEVTGALAETYFRFGVRCLASKNGRLVKGIAALEQARSLRGDDERCVYFLAVACFMNGDFERAAKLFEEAVRFGRTTQRMQAWALALERAGRHEEAVKVWKDLIDNPPSEPLARIEGMLGLAGMFARMAKWAEAASFLERVLADSEGVLHRAYADLCKLTVSYLSMSGKHESAQAIIQRHSQSLDGDTVNTYLAALLAQQGRLAEAAKHLEKIVVKKSVPSDVLDFFEAVCLTLAAGLVLENKLDLARQRLQAVMKVRANVSPETQAFVQAILAAGILGDAASLEQGEAALSAYHTAYRAQPNDASIVRNYAILNHRLAIACEEAGTFKKADRYWHKSSELWTNLATDHGFWRQYLCAFNEGRHRREQLNKNDLDGVAQKLLRSLAMIHAEFAKGYALSGSNAARLGTHLKHLRALDGTKDFLQQVADAILSEVLPRLRGSNDEALCAALEEADKALELGSDKFTNIIVDVALGAAIKALLNSNVDQFKRHISRVSRHMGDAGDLRKMATTAARADGRFIRNVLQRARNVLNIIPNLPSGHPVIGQVLLQVVLNMCQLRDSLDYDQRFMLDLQLDSIIGKVIIEAIQTHLKR